MDDCDYHLSKEYLRVEKDSFHRLSSCTIPLIIAKSFEQAGGTQHKWVGGEDPETLLIVSFF
jgi:hypothetical protein